MTTAQKVINREIRRQLLNGGCCVIDRDFFKNINDRIDKLNQKGQTK